MKAMFLWLICSDTVFFPKHHYISYIFGDTVMNSLVYLLQTHLKDITCDYYISVNLIKVSLLPSKYY